MGRLHRMLLVMVVLSTVTVLSSGCAYLKNRGNDLVDTFDMGITFTEKPRVGVFISFNSLLAAGYSNIDDGKLLGFAQRNVGWLDMRYQAAGALLYGYEQWGYDDNFDKNDPKSPKRRGDGLGLIDYESPKGFCEALQCGKILHLGFIGLNLNCRLGDIMDLVLGLTTLDICGDDKF